MMTILDFDAWYRDERPKVVASVGAITGRPSIADEAADEAFTRAVERWHRVQRMDSPGGWVHRTALNVARRRLRRDGHERRLLRTIAAGAPFESAPPTWPVELWECLRSLPPRQREAMVLRHVADLSVIDVATAMGVTVGTASAALHAARQRLSSPPDDGADDHHGNADLADEVPPARPPNSPHPMTQNPRREVPDA